MGVWPAGVRFHGAHVPSPRRFLGGKILRVRVSEMKDRSVKKVTNGGRGRERPMKLRLGPGSFVLTLWVEPRDTGADPEWRWKVSHVQTDQQAYFANVADVLSYVASQSGLPAPR